MIGRVVTRSTTELDADIEVPESQIAAQNPIRLKAATEAAADGHRKARAHAEGVGARVGQLITLQSSTRPPASRAGGEYMLAAAPPDSMPIVPGEHEVMAAVEVSFALELD